ncbi:MAG: hypothetical protein WCK39_07550 [Methanomassiliicoccales archaeon]
MSKAWGRPGGGRSGAITLSSLSGGRPPDVFESVIGRWPWSGVAWGRLGPCGEYPAIL